MKCVDEARTKTSSMISGLKGAVTALLTLHLQYMDSQLTFIVQVALVALSASNLPKK